MFIQIVLIFNLVYYLRCDGNNESNVSLDAEAGKHPMLAEPTPRPSVYIDSNTYMFIIVIFITVVCSLSIVALMFGFKKGQKDVKQKNKTEKQNDQQFKDFSDDHRIDEKTVEGTTVAPLYKTESLTAVPGDSESNDTIRSISEEDVGKPKGSPTNSEVLAYSTEVADTPNTEEEAKPQWDSLEKNKDLKNDPNNSSDKQ